MGAKKSAPAEELDAKFEAGEDLAEYLDMDSAVKRVNVDFPLWMMTAMDRWKTACWTG